VVESKQAGNAKHRRRLLLGAVFMLAAIPAAGALEFRSVGETTVLYDAPSTKARKLYVVSRGYPVEVVVVVEGWVKVRDASGELTWIESRYLSDKRTVMIKVPLAQIRQSADESAPVVFQAQENVVLELVEEARGGWIKVRHRDGQSGFVKLAEVWGA
jgi:SH3-like domain-containing protein